MSIGRLVRLFLSVSDAFYQFLAAYARSFQFYCINISLFQLLHKVVTILLRKIQMKQKCFHLFNIDIFSNNANDYQLEWFHGYYTFLFYFSLNRNPLTDTGVAHLSHALENNGSLQILR